MYTAIQRLRLVSHNFKDFVDLVRPDYHFNKISIQAQPDSVSLTLVGKKCTAEMQYKKHKEGALLKIGGREVLVKEVHYIDAMFRELKEIICRQGSLAEKLEVVMIPRQLEMRDLVARISRNCRSIVADSKKLLRVSAIHVFYKLRYLRDFLSIVDPKHLKRIGLRFMGGDREDIRIEDLMEMEQWKAAVELEQNNYHTPGVRREISPSPFRADHLVELARFTRLNIRVDSVNRGQLENLKRIYLNSPNFKDCFIRHDFHDEFVGVNRHDVARWQRRDVLDRELNPQERRELRQAESPTYVNIPGSDQLFVQQFARNLTRFSRSRSFEDLMYDPFN